jgi:hypothetical protein
MGMDNGFGVGSSCDAPIHRLDTTAFAECRGSIILGQLNDRNYSMQNEICSTAELLG